MLRTDSRVEVLEAELASVRRAFEAAVDAVPEPLRGVAPAGRWSTAQVVWHCAKVERSIARLIERQTAAIGPMATVPPGPSPHAVLRVLDHIPFLDRTQRLEAPEGIRPPDAVDLVTERGRLADGRMQLLAAMRDCGPRLSLVRHPHQFFGDFDGWQWVLMIARHEERHLLQIEETVAELR